MNSLVVYYSRAGNAKFVAQTIAVEINADVEEIIDQKNRSGPIGWLNAGKDARKGSETVIAPIKKDPANYDLIVVGKPNWASRITSAIRTYLKNSSLRGKRVAAFVVQDGDTPFPSDKIKSLVPDAIWIGYISITKALKSKQEKENQIIEWTKTLR